ncbi:MAG TPA: outer membrane beta-barrel protein [Bacteroidales bacterium]|nr:outer membrane beta-barrel protein [Bacteroidales bacterium]
MKNLRYLVLSLALFSGIITLGQGYVTTTYNVALPLGNTKDFIDKTSPRGFGIEAGAWLNDNVSLGLEFSWNGFYKEYDYDTYYNIDGSTLTLSGRMWRYTNVYPLMGVVKYYLNSDSDFEAFLGAGLGTFIINKRTDFGLYTLEDHQWHFALYPEVGFIYWFSDAAGFTFNTRYNWAAKSGDIDAQSNLGFNFGFVFYSF